MKSLGPWFATALVIALAVFITWLASLTDGAAKAACKHAGGVWYSTSRGGGTCIGDRPASP